MKILEYTLRLQLIIIITDEGKKLEVPINQPREEFRDRLLPS